MFARLAPIAALIAGILLSAQMPGPAGWPPGVFLDRGALDAGASVSTITTPILSGTNTAPTTTGNNFGPLVGGQGSSSVPYSATIGLRELPVAISGTLSNLSINFPSGVGSGSYTTSVTLNGSSTGAPTCTVSSGNLCSDSSHPLSVTAGNTAGINIVGTSSPTSNTNIQYALTFVGINSNESLLSGGAVLPSNSANNWAPIQGWGVWFATNDAIASNVMPAAGKIDQLYVIGSSAPGASKSYTITVFQNGSAGGSPGNLSCEMTGTGSGAGITSCNDLTDVITVAQGDTISVQSSPAGTPTASAIRWGVRWRPTTTGQSLMLMSDTNTIPGTTATTYTVLNGGGNGAAAETGGEVISPVFSGGFSIQSMYVAFSAAPTTGTRTITLRNPAGTSSTSMLCALSLAATSSCSGTTAVTGIGASSATLLDWMHVSAAATATTSYKVGAVMTVP